MKCIFSSKPFCCLDPYKVRDLTVLHPLVNNPSFASYIIVVSLLFCDNFIDFQYNFAMLKCHNMSSDLFRNYFPRFFFFGLKTILFVEGVGDKEANNEIIKTLFELRPYEGFNKLPLAYCVSSFLIQKKWQNERNFIRQYNRKRYGHRPR